MATLWFAYIVKCCPAPCCASVQRAAGGSAGHQHCGHQLVCSELGLPLFTMIMMAYVSSVLHPAHMALMSLCLGAILKAETGFQWQ